MSSYPPSGTSSGQSGFGQTSGDQSDSSFDANRAASSTSGSLISSERVTGTNVYNHDGERLGTVEAMMIDKQSGQVRYAIMSFGGFLGMGEKYHQLPWDGLSYDTEEGGYVVNLDREALGSAPTYSREELDNFDYGKSGSIDDYYSNVDGFRRPGR